MSVFYRWGDLQASHKLSGVMSEILEKSANLAVLIDGVDEFVIRG